MNSFFPRGGCASSRAIFSCGHARRFAGGFTFVEVLMALAIAAGVIATAVLAYEAVARSGSRMGSYGPVQLPEGTLQDLYGDGGNYVDAYFAPNYGRVVQAEILRDLLYTDISQATAVFCLARSGQTAEAHRPSSIPVSVDYDVRRLNTASAFQTFLEGAVPDTAGVFTEYRGAATAQNLSIFVLMPSASATSLTVRAIYEVDFIPTTNPAGTYATVRRYQGTVCTDFYDVFYPASSGTVAFLPVAAEFERAARQASGEGDPDLLKLAANRPFYFIWWPDPATPTLETQDGTSLASSDPRSAYETMIGRTSLFMVLPMFPAL